MIDKKTEKLENYKSSNIERKLNNMGQAMNIEKVNECNLSFVIERNQKEIEEFRQQNKSLDS